MVDSESCFDVPPWNYGFHVLRSGNLEAVKKFFVNPTPDIMILLTDVGYAINALSYIAERGHKQIFLHMFDMFCAVRPNTPILVDHMIVSMMRFGRFEWLGEFYHKYFEKIQLSPTSLQMLTIEARKNSDPRMLQWCSKLGK
jgi:hypothetical protein